MDIWVNDSGPYWQFSLAIFYSITWVCRMPIHCNEPTIFGTVQFSCSVVSDSLRPHESQHATPLCPSQTPGVHSDSSPSSQWCYPAISSSGVPFSSCPNPSQHLSLFQWVKSSHEIAKVLEFQLQNHSLQRNPRADLLQNGLVGSPCSPRDSQEFSPTPQFKASILQRSAFFNHWKNHSLD